MNTIQQAEQAGFDLSFMEDESLKLTYEQRALQHQEALNLALELGRVGKLLRSLETGASTEAGSCRLALSAAKPNILA